MADAEPADREAGQRADQQRQQRRHRAEVEAVRKLAPEVLQVPVALGQHTPEALDRRDPRPDVVGEHVALRLQRDQHHVVDRQDRPHHEDQRQQRRPCGGQISPAPHGTLRLRLRVGGGQGGVDGNRAHSCTCAVRSLRIRTITSGITIGSADITAATPRRGCAISKALRMPSVANTWVEFAGPPPETK